MTELEKDLILSANKTRAGLTRIYEHKDKELIFYSMLQLEDVKNSLDYYKVLVELNNLQKERFALQNVDCDIFVEHIEKKRYLDNFKEEYKELLSRYWDETIGYSAKKINNIYNYYVENLCDILAKLENKFLKTCSIDMDNFAIKLQQILSNQLPSKQFKIQEEENNGNNYLFLTIGDIDGELLEKAKKGVENVIFLGDKRLRVNPYTAEPIINEGVEYTRNLLQTENVKPYLKPYIIDAINEVLVGTVKKSFSEITFKDSQIYADALDDLYNGYYQVKKIFDEDVKRFMSSKIIYKQKKYLLNSKDANSTVNELINEYQEYVDKTFDSINNPFKQYADKKFKYLESPFPEFD